MDDFKVGVCAIEIYKKLTASIIITITIALFFP